MLTDGDWAVPHSLALFERADVLCIADRENERVDCIKAGIQVPRYANKDETGMKVVSYPGIGKIRRPQRYFTVKVHSVKLVG